MSALRSEVLRCFKALHRTRKLVFKDDQYALAACRSKINEEFNKSKHVTDESVVSELLKYCKEVEQELRTSVVQAQEVQPGQYKLKITENTRKLVNVPYSDETPTYRENQCANPDNCHCKGGS